MFRHVVAWMTKDGPCVPSGLQSILAHSTIKISSSCEDFIAKLLILDPERRLSAAEALQHPFLTQEEPLPCAPADLPRFEEDIS